MGRRHFNFSPVVRGSLDGPVVWPPHAERRHGHAPKTLCDTAPCFTPSRRMFPHGEGWFEKPAPFIPAKRLGYQQAMASDSNLDASPLNDLHAKRRCPAPPFAKPAEPSQKKHYVPGDDFASVQEPQFQDVDVWCGKRHIPAPTGHLIREGQVWRDDSSPCGRRHRPDGSWLLKHPHSERRSLTTPQRRHLAAQDHLWGPSIFATVRIPPICGDRKARRCSSSCSWSPAVVAEPSDEGSHSLLARRPCRPVRRRGGKAPRDHLVGAMARPTSAPAGSMRPLKRRSHLGSSVSSLEGGGLVRLTGAASPTISPFVPDDHLFGWEVL